jgi:hypothetical protein
MLYELKFIDGTNFKGGNLKNTRWNEIPDKPIDSITYYFMGRQIRMKGFDAYVNVKFFGKNLNSNQGDLLYATAIMAKKGCAVWRFIFDLQNHTFTRDVVPFGQENEGKPVTGWKIGFTNKPIVEVK